MLFFSLWNSLILCLKRNVKLFPIYLLLSVKISFILPTQPSCFPGQWLEYAAVTPLFKSEITDCLLQKALTVYSIKQEVTSLFLNAKLLSISFFSCVFVLHCYNNHYLLCNTKFFFLVAHKRILRFRSYFVDLSLSIFTTHCPFALTIRHCHSINLIQKEHLGNFISLRMKIMAQSSLHSIRSYPISWPIRVFPLLRHCKFSLILAITQQNWLTKLNRQMFT